MRNWKHPMKWKGGDEVAHEWTDSLQVERSTLDTSSRPSKVPYVVCTLDKQFALHALVDNKLTAPSNWGDDLPRSRHQEHVKITTCSDSQAESNTHLHLRDLR